MANDVPDDILFWSILIKLPVKSLVRFKSVSTQWSVVFSQSKFVRTHLEINKKDSSYKDFILYEKNYNSASVFLTRISADNHFSSKPLEAKELLPSPLRKRNITRIESIMHCDGILCIYTQCSRFVVWNPLNNVQKIFKKNNKRQSDWEAFGFGYDPTIDDYKIVYVTGNKSSVKLRRIQVLKVKTGLWTDAAAESQTECLIYFGRYFTNCQVGTYVDGCLYWMARFHQGGKVIVSFDLGKETMRYEHSLSNGNFLNSSNYGILLVFSGSLCLVSKNKCRDGNADNYVFDIWLMKKRNDDDVPKWRKLITMPCDDPWDKIPRPICFVEKIGEKVLLVNYAFDRKLFVYSAKGEESVKIGSCYNKFHVIPFNGSLVSP